MSKKILVIDDEELIIKSLTKLLEKNGFTVFVAKNGQDALAMAEEEKFDLIIADIRMPGMNGVDFIQALEAQGHKKILFFITGYHDFPRDQLQKFSPRAIMFKPFDVEEAAILIKNHVMRLAN